MGVTSGLGTAYPSKAPSVPPVVNRVRVTRSLVLYLCFVDRCLSLCIFFWPWCCLLFCLLAMVLSALLRYTNSDYPFSISNSSYATVNGHLDGMTHMFKKTRKTYRVNILVKHFHDGILNFYI